MKKAEQIPILGYWTPQILNTLKKEMNTFFILEGDKLLGIALFKNLTVDFRKNMIGKLWTEFKSKADVDSYLFYYSVLHNERENDIITKNMLNKLFNMFISMNSLQNKSFMIILLQILQVQINNMDSIIKYKPIIEYVLTGVDKYKNLGFEYNGHHINLNNDIINVFIKRYIKSSSFDVNNYYPTYIITRQLDNFNASNMSNLENLLTKERLYLVQNVYKFCLNNMLVYYNNFIENSLYSIFKCVPYEFNFVMNYITNELGNNHIICNYVFLYKALINYYGSNSREIQNFAKIIDNLDDIYNLLDDKKYLTVRNFNISTDSTNFHKLFNNKDKFIEYYNDKSKQLLYGYYVYNSTYKINIIPIKDNLHYVITKTLVFTYINKELKMYIINKGGILIGNYTFLDMLSDIQNYAFKVMIFPDDYKNLVKDPITDNDINKLSNLITENCKSIGKMYKKHVVNDINQINGFRSVHIYMIFIKENGEYKVIIDRTAYFNKLSSRNNYEHSDWINEIAIKPALYKGYKTNNPEPHYQPVDID